MTALNFERRISDLLAEARRCTDAERLWQIAAELELLGAWTESQTVRGMAIEEGKKLAEVNS